MALWCQPGGGLGGEPKWKLWRVKPDPAPETGLQAEDKTTAKLGSMRRAPSRERSRDHSGKPLRSPLRTSGEDEGDDSRDKTAKLVLEPGMAGVVFTVRGRAETWTWADMASSGPSYLPPYGPPADITVISAPVEPLPQHRLSTVTTHRSELACFSSLEVS